ncbi:O-antigen ligase family protein [Pseudogulbenkiania sp. MAI-1]|uniref:O-antigen ligase family protein n=1 Tax=Pseudogulbenkiania sp. MAI-1 TaxID=990370 RepID=UPI0004B6C84F|nr:O-antigen ligase family protein [Pseudogulbenkiania sp. MAI-1]
MSTFTCVLDGDKTPSANIKSKAVLSLHILLFTAGWDLSAINISGFSVRLAWILLLAIPLLIPIAKHKKTALAFIILFYLVHVFSSLLSDNPLQGLLYSFWIVFTYLFFLHFACSACNILQAQTWNVILVNGRLQIFFAFLLYLTGIQERANFIYYEPSYMAIALIPYVATIFHLRNIKGIDVAALISYIISSQSGNFLVVLLLAGLLRFLMGGLNMRKLKLLFLIFLGGLLFTYYLLHDESNINHATAKAILTSGASIDSAIAIAERGGNRVPRMQVALEIFWENPFTGIGPTNYISHIDGRNFSHITKDIPWIDPEGQPPTNAFIEAGVNAGILAVILLTVPFFYIIKKNRLRSHHSDDSKIVSAAGIIIFIMMNLDSNYLRAYVWVFFGLAISSLSWRIKQNANCVNNNA